MLRYENIAYQQLLKSMLNLCRERKEAVDPACATLEHLHEMTKKVFGNDSLDETGLYETLSACENYAKTLRNSRYVTGSTDFFHFYSDAISLLQVYRRRSLNKATIDVIEFMKQECNYYRDKTYAGRPMPAESRMHCENFFTKAAQLAKLCTGEEISDSDFAAYLRSREELIERGILRGLVGRIAQNYWRALDQNGTQYDERTVLSKTFNELSMRIAVIVDGREIPSVCRHTYSELMESRKELHKTLVGCFSFLSSIVSAVECEKRARYPLCNNELAFVESCVMDLLPFVDELDKSSTPYFYNESALLRAKCSRIL